MLKLLAQKDLKPNHVVLGNLEDVNAGEGVFAVGNPLGLERSVSQGILSNRNRNISSGQVYPQTDAATALATSAVCSSTPGRSDPASPAQRLGRHGRQFGFRDPRELRQRLPSQPRGVRPHDKENLNTGYRFLDPPPSPPPENPSLGEPKHGGEAQAGNRGNEYQVALNEERQEVRPPGREPVTAGRE